MASAKASIRVGENLNNGARIIGAVWTRKVRIARAECAGNLAPADVRINLVGAWRWRVRHHRKGNAGSRYRSNSRGAGGTAR